MPNRPRRDVPETTTEAEARVIDAAIAAILDVGYYRASSNEIARRAGVSWGVIQHYYGNREKLMLAVLQHGQRQLARVVESATIDSPTLEGRLEQLLDILAEHYGAPEYLAQLQILLDLGEAPNTSDEVRAMVKETSANTIDDVVRLTRAALGPAYSAEMTSTIFLTLRGFAISELLARVNAHDALPVTPPEERRRRRLLAHALAPYFETLLEDRDPTPS